MASSSIPLPPRPWLPLRRHPLVSGSCCRLGTTDPRVDDRPPGCLCRALSASPVSKTPHITSSVCVTSSSCGIRVGSTARFVSACSSLESVLLQPEVSPSAPTAITLRGRWLINSSCTDSEWRARGPSSGCGVHASFRTHLALFLGSRLAGRWPIPTARLEASHTLTRSVTGMTLTWGQLTWVTAWSRGRFVSGGEQDNGWPSENPSAILR